jgi:uncharacterized protein with ACT and thioredoxin-like domain
VESVIEQAGQAVVSDVLQEAVKEVTGRSTRKWALVLIAFVLGSVVAVAVINLRQRRAIETVGEPMPGS